MIATVILIFIASILGIYFSGELVVMNVIRLTRLLGIGSFLIAFFLMGVASSLPNLFVGIGSAINKIPELSLGDVLGNDFIDLTITISLAILFSTYKKIKVENLFIRQSFVFMILAGLSPIFLILDGVLSRSDGIFLLLLFSFYVWWSFSRQKFNESIYKTATSPPSLKNVLKEWFIYKYFLKIALGLIILFFSARGIIFTSEYLANYLKIPYYLIGMLIVGFGNALPEMYFAVSSSRKGEFQIALGDFIGAIISPATFVLGIVSIIHPIFIKNLLLLEISRFFYIITAIVLFWSVTYHKELNKKTAFFLIIMYILFLLVIKNVI